MSVSVIVASCLHMDSTYIGRFDPDLGIHTNWNEALKQLRKIVTYCNGKSIDWLILNGDVFHTGRPMPEAVLRLRMELDKLDGTKVIMEPGNHDLSNINSSHSDPLSAYFSNERWCERVVTEPTVLHLDGLHLAVMPWFRVSGQSEIDNVGSRMQEHIERMSGEIDRYNDEATLFAGHLTTLSAANSFSKRGSELTMSRTGLEAIVDEELLDHGAWDKYALGHIHTRQNVGKVGKGLYTGSTHRVTFSEEKEKKGCYLYEWDDSGQCSVKFLNLQGRRLATVDLSDTSKEQIIPESKYKYMKKDDYLKIILPYDFDLDDMPGSVSTTIDDLIDEGINIELRNAPAPKSEKIVTSIPQNDEASPLEMLSAYFDDREDVDSEQKDRITKIFKEIEEVV